MGRLLNDHLTGRRAQADEGLHKTNMHTWGDQYVNRTIPPLSVEGQIYPALFLASDLMSHDITGVCLPVDAGSYMPYSRPCYGLQSTQKVSVVMINTILFQEGKQMAAYEGVEMSPTMFEHLKGASTGVRNMDYTWRDISLYNLSIGAKREDTPYFYERDAKGLKAFPSFAVIPYLNNITMRTITPEPDGTNEIFRNYVERLLGHLPSGLHMAMEMIFDTPLDPYGGTFVVTDHLNEIFDRGEGKGVVADCGMDVYDQAGRHMAELHSYHLTKAFGGFGGKTFQAPKVVFPDRKPDVEVTEYMIPEIAAFYRLVGDTYRVHVDFDYAKSYGYEAPFNMGMCTYGYGVRMIAHQLIPYEPERITYLYAQIRSLCFPGQNVTAQAWEVEPGTVYWKLLSQEGKTLIGNGIMKYRV